ncbi:MAG: NYN domain-containing protein, partial [Promethearchaeota archaeon]
MTDEDGINKELEQVQDQSSRLLTRVAVFWDIENCQPPSIISGTSLVQDLRLSLLEFGSIRQIRAYADLKLLKGSLRLELQRSGIQLLDVPSTKKDSADKMMLTDMLMFALDYPPPQRIVLISGDQDFAYTLARLRNIGYEIVLIIPPVGAHPTLRAQADFIINWQDLFQLRKDLTDETYLESLLEVLKELQERGEYSPAFALVGKRLNQRYPAWRKDTGQQKLMDYVEAAKSQGFVKITGKPPKLRVSLVEDKLKESREIAKKD